VRFILSPIIFISLFRVRLIEERGSLTGREPVESVVLMIKSIDKTYWLLAFPSRKTWKVQKIEDVYPILIKRGRR
jgi:hypothetical protein